MPFHLLSPSFLKNSTVLWCAVFMKKLLYCRFCTTKLFYKLLCFVVSTHFFLIPRKLVLTILVVASNVLQKSFREDFSLSFFSVRKSRVWNHRSMLDLLSFLWFKHYVSWFSTPGYPVFDQNWIKLWLELLLFIYQ